MQPLCCLRPGPHPLFVGEAGAAAPADALVFMPGQNISVLVSLRARLLLVSTSQQMRCTECLFPLPTMYARPPAAWQPVLLPGVYPLQLPPALWGPRTVLCHRSPLALSHAADAFLFVYHQATQHVWCSLPSQCRVVHVCVFVCVCVWAVSFSRSGNRLTGCGNGPCVQQPGYCAAVQTRRGLRVVLLMCKRDDGTHAQPPWPRNWQPPAPIQGGTHQEAAVHVPCLLRVIYQQGVALVHGAVLGCAWVAHCTTLVPRLHLPVHTCALPGCTCMSTYPGCVCVPVFFVARSVCGVYVSTSSTLFVCI